MPIAGSLISGQQRRKAAYERHARTHERQRIRTAIRELSARAELARKEGRPDDADELEQRIQRYRDELGERP